MLCLATLPAGAASGDAEAGKTRAKLCVACHGANGVSAIPGIPSLAGQRDGFLQWQLVFFRSGRRNNPVMTPLAGTLSDEDVRNVAAYFASLPPVPPATKDADQALHDTGAAIVEQHHCASCHTDDFTGKAAAASIAHQREEYLAKALTEYRSGARPSVGVAAMTEAASGLSDDDIKAVAHYLATFKS